MEPIEREDSSTYVNRPPETGRPAQQDAPQQPRQFEQPEGPKPKKSKAAGILAFLLLLALIGAGVLGWMWNQETARANAAETDAATANKKVSALEAQNETLAADAKEENEVEASSDDSAEMIATALAYAKSIKGAGATTAKLVKTEGDFASVNLTVGQTVETAVLKKSDERWIVLTSSAAPVTKETVDRFSIPTSVVAN